jgi:hypothetical protein
MNRPEAARTPVGVPGKLCLGVRLVSPEGQVPAGVKTDILHAEGV